WAIDPIVTRVETAEAVKDRVLEAAEHIEPSRLGTCDDCGFAPFGDDTSTTRETAFAKIQARVAGTQLRPRNSDSEQAQAVPSMPTSWGAGQAWRRTGFARAAPPIWRQKCPFADSRAGRRVCQASLFPEAEGRLGRQWRCWCEGTDTAGGGNPRRPPGGGGGKTRGETPSSKPPRRARARHPPPP